MKDTSNAGENISCTEQEIADKAPKQSAEKKPADPARRPRRASGPQIYGQGDAMADPKNMYSQQGMIRRDVQARGTQGAAGRPVRQPMNANGVPAGRPMNGNGAPAGRPMNANGAPAGRPMNANGVPAGRPMNANGAPAGRPMNGNGVPAGRPMNGNGAPAGQPMNTNGAPAGQPMNGNGTPVRPNGMPVNMQGRPGMGVPMVHPGRRMESARAALKSPLLILVALLNTVCLAGAIAAIFMHQMNYSQFIRLISDINMPAQLAGYMDSAKKLLSMLDSGMLPVNLALHIPDLFLCLGFWLVCITARTAKEKMSGIGFLCMKVFVVINMIVTCVVVLLGLILSVTLVVAAWVSGTKNMIILAAVMLVVMIITALASIMYYFCYLATIKVCRLNAGTGEPYGQASSYVALVHVIVGLTGIVGLLSGIVNAEISNIAGYIGKIGWMLLFALWIILYRRKMSEFED